MAEASNKNSTPVWLYQPPLDNAQIQEAAVTASAKLSLELIQEFPIQYLTETFDGDIKKTDGQLTVDLIKNIVEVKMKKISNVRYIGLRMVDNLGPVLVLSSRDSSFRNVNDPTINFLFFQTMDEDLVSSIEVMNSIRRFQFEMVVSDCSISLQEAAEVVDFNQLYVMGDLPCQIEEENEENYFCIMDRECLCLFPYQFGETPIYKYLFWKEPGLYVVENIVMVHGMHFIKLECERRKVSITNLEQKVCSEFVNTLKNIRFSQPKVVFQDYKELYLHLINRPLRSNSQSTSGIEISQRGQHSQSSKDFVSFQGQYLKGQSFLPSKDYIPSDFESKYLQAELNDAEEICKKLEDYEDMIAPLWVAAEEEMKLLLTSGIIPASEFDSGGFDPNNYEHLLKCLQDAEDKILEQSYDLALSRIIGIKKTFSSSDDDCIRNIFKGEDDLSLLKKLFFRNFSLQKTGENLQRH